MTYVSHVLPQLQLRLTAEQREARTAAQKRKKRPPETGYKLNRKRERNCLLTEHQVIEARWLHEFGFWSYSRLAKHYGRSRQYIYDLVQEYSVRSKVRPPRPDDFPPGYEPQPAPRGLFSASDTAAHQEQTP